MTILLPVSILLQPRDTHFKTGGVQQRSLNMPSYFTQLVLETITDAPENEGFDGLGLVVLRTRTLKLQPKASFIDKQPSSSH